MSLDASVDPQQKREEPVGERDCDEQRGDPEYDDRDTLTDGLPRACLHVSQYAASRMGQCSGMSLEPELTDPVSVWQVAVL
jgi:hypothetical protein